MGTVVELSGKEANLLRALRAVGKESEKMEKGFSKATREAKKLEKAGKRTFEQTRTPAEKLRNTLRGLRTQLKGGAIDQNTFNRATKKAKENFLAAGRAGKGAFGSVALGNLKGMAGGLSGVATAATLVARAMRDASAARLEAGQKTTEAEFPLSKLAQLATSQAHLNQLIETTKEVAKGGGGRNLSEAAAIVFQLESAGAIKESPKFAQAEGVIDVGAIIQASATLRQALGPKETGSFGALTSKGIAGAAPVPGATAGDILTGAARSAVEAKKLSLSDEEVIAAITNLSRKTKSVDIASTQLSSLLRSLIRLGFADREKKLPLREIIKLPQFQGGEARLQKKLGRAEASAGLSGLRGSGLEARTKEIRKAEKDDLFQQRVGFARNNPTIRAAFEKRISKNQQEVAEIRVGEASNLADAVVADRIARDRKAGVAGFAIAITGYEESISRFFSDEAFLRHRASIHQAGDKSTTSAVRSFLGLPAEKFVQGVSPFFRNTQNVDPGNPDRVVDAINKQTEATERQTVVLEQQNSHLESAAERATGPMEPSLSNHSE